MTRESTTGEHGQIKAVNIWILFCTIPRPNVMVVINEVGDKNNETQVDLQR